MQFALVFRLVGLMTMLFASTLLPPVAVALWYHDAMVWHFLAAAVACLLVGALMWWPSRRGTQWFRVRDGFLVTALLWFVLTTLAALPFCWSPRLQMTWVDAWFEAMSGLTTTGASIIPDLEQLSRGMLYYRQQLQWVGGMGIIVLAVAILPKLGVGGMQLYEAEMPGPGKHDKLTPRIAQTAKALWLIYVGLTAACLIAYRLGGMAWFDAMGESLATVSTGGFSMHNTGFAYYHHYHLHLIACLFMVLSVISFTLHYTALHERSLKAYWQSEELRFFLCLLVVVLLWVILVHWWHVHQGHAHLAWEVHVFTVVAMATNTGFAATDYAYWPGGLPIVLMFGGLLGGCAGSTSGGLKVMRLVVLIKQGRREVLRLLHPSGVFTIKLNHEPMSSRIAQSVTAFLAVFSIIYVLLIVVLLAMGVGWITAFGAVTSTLSNLGASIGGVAQNYAHLSPTIKVMLTVAMLAGRLEIFTLLVLLYPSFWRR